MSRDIFVQDIPEFAASVEEIPDDWMAEPLRFTPADIIESVKAHASHVDESDPSWLHIADAGIDIELNLDNETPFMSFAFHDRSTDRDASDRLIASPYWLGREGVRSGGVGNRHLRAAPVLVH